MQFDVNVEPRGSKMAVKGSDRRQGDRVYAEDVRRRGALFRVFWNSITARDEVSARERFIKRDIFSCISLPALTRPAGRGNASAEPRGLSPSPNCRFSRSPVDSRRKGTICKTKEQRYSRSRIANKLQKSSLLRCSCYLRPRVSTKRCGKDGGIMNDYWLSIYILYRNRG